MMDMSASSAISGVFAQVMIHGSDGVLEIGYLSVSVLSRIPGLFWVSFKSIVRQRDA
jgi:hypothetical protein